MSDCECVYISAEDTTWPDVYDRRIVVARKAWMCIECTATIPPQSEYEHARGLWDGDWRTFRTCMRCLSIREAFFCGTYIHGCLVEDLAAHIRRSPVSQRCLDALTLEARSFVVETIDAIERDRECI